MERADRGSPRATAVMRRGTIARAATRSDLHPFTSKTKDPPRPLSLSASLLPAAYFAAKRHTHKGSRVFRGSSPSSIPRRSIAWSLGLSARVLYDTLRFLAEKKNQPFTHTHYCSFAMTSTSFCAASKNAGKMRIDE